MTSGLAIYDTMQYIRARSRRCASARRPRWARCCWPAGAKGKRISLPNARIMIHQPSGGAQGQATDIELQAQEILKLKRRLNEIYVQAYRPAAEEDRGALERDKFLTAERPRSSG